MAFPCPHQNEAPRYNLQNYKTVGHRITHRRAMSIDMYRMSPGA